MSRHVQVNSTSTLTFIPRQPVSHNRQLIHMAQNTSLQHRISHRFDLFSIVPSCLANKMRIVTMPEGSVCYSWGVKCGHLRLRRPGVVYCIREKFWGACDTLISTCASAKYVLWEAHPVRYLRLGVIMLQLCHGGFALFLWEEEGCMNFLYVFIFYFYEFGIDRCIKYK